MGNVLSGLRRLGRATGEPHDGPVDLPENDYDDLRDTVVTADLTAYAAVDLRGREVVAYDELSPEALQADAANGDACFFADDDF